MEGRASLDDQQNHQNYSTKGERENGSCNRDLVEMLNIELIHQSKSLYSSLSFTISSPIPKRNKREPQHHNTIHYQIQANI